MAANHKIRRMIAETREAAKKTNKIEFIRFNKTRESKKVYSIGRKAAARSNSTFVLCYQVIHHFSPSLFLSRGDAIKHVVEHFFTLRKYYVYPNSWFTFLQLNVDQMWCFRIDDAKKKKKKNDGRPINIKWNNFSLLTGLNGVSWFNIVCGCGTGYLRFGFITHFYLYAWNR